MIITTTHVYLYIYIYIHIYIYIYIHIYIYIYIYVICYLRVFGWYSAKTMFTPTMFSRGRDRGVGKRGRPNFTFRYVENYDSARVTKAYLPYSTPL